MSITVQKFNPNTLSTPERMLAAARKVASTRRAGYKPVVVVPERSDAESRDLLEAVQEIVGEKARRPKGKPSKRELDVLLSVGEMQAAALFAIALSTLGEKANALSSRQAGIYTNQDGGITRIDTSWINKLLESHVIPIIPGAQGIEAATSDFVRFGDSSSDGAEITALELARALRGRYEVVTFFQEDYKPRIRAKERIGPEIVSLV